MKLDSKGRPICIGQGPTRKCGADIHPGYCRCWRCDRPYTGEEIAWCKEQWAKQDAEIAAKAKGPTP